MPQRKVEFPVQQRLAPWATCGLTAMILAAILFSWYQSRRGVTGGAAADTPREAGVSAEESAAPPQQEPPKITITEVAPGVYYLDFDGYFCSDAACIQRAFSLVHEWAAPVRIVDVEPIGEYGSPTALIVITAPAKQ